MQGSDLAGDVTGGQSLPTEADLVVIGGGSAGLTAAISAAEHGCARTVVLEMMAATGGNSAFGDGVFAIDSPLQRERGITVCRDEFIRKATAWNHWKNDARVVAAYISKSGDTIGWLQQKGIKFELRRLYPEQTPIVWHMTPGSELVRMLRRECEQAGVEVLTHVRATKIVTGPDGGTRGVMTASKDGECLISAKSVLIATGGFGGSRELMQRLVPFYADSIDYVGRANNVGDGLRMAEEVGCAVDQHVALLIEGPNTRTPLQFAAAEDGERQPNGVVGTMLRSLGMVAKSRFVLWLNRNGQRFIAESDCPVDMASANAIIRQPDGVCFAVFDAKICEMIEEQGLINTVAPSLPMMRVEGLAEQLEQLQEHGVCKVAASWADIAEWMTAEEGVLSREIKQYNGACDRGYDELLLKDKRMLVPLRCQPFYAIRCHTVLMDTIGGIRVTENMEVLGRQVRIIPGLFAAGVCAGGVHGDLYNYDLAGSALGFGVNSGRIAGESAARFIRERA